MRNKDVMDTAQSAYLLEYDRRRIRVCADTFQNLARIFGEDDGRERDYRNGQEAGNAAQRQERTARLLRKRLAEGRQLFAGNLKEMADMMNQVAEESVRFISLGSRRQKQLVRGLAGEGLNARDIYLVQRGDGRMELSVSLSSRSRNSRTVEEAADYLSVLLNMRLVPSKRNPFFIGEEMLCYFFEEEPSYLYMTGMARAVKETETVSGDSFASFEASDGNLTVLLSDGMGSGEDACRDSEAVADMTESMLEAGLPPEMTVAFLNSAVASEGRAESLPTLDLCSIDLYEGECIFLKTGAAASFIKRGSAVERIEGATFPLGAFSDAQTQKTRRGVSDGDYIILMSDGMTEGWPGGDGEEKLERFISRLNEVSPAEISNTLLRYALEECRGRIRDDMTVLTVGIWEKKDEE